MKIAFTKMHGAGNDFVVIDATRQPFALTKNQIQQISDRRTGVGCDQLLVVEPSNSDHIDFCYRIFNASGDEVGQCGNGARCLARFIKEKNLSDKDVLEVATNTTNMTLYLKGDLVAVDMGVPLFSTKTLPFLTDSIAETYTLPAYSKPFSIVSLGNPHIVFIVDDVDKAPVDDVGAMLSVDSQFPEGVNVGFMQIIDDAHIRLRVFERNVGETLACGSGACAAVVVARNHGFVSDSVYVALRGGELSIVWPGHGEHVLMEGPAAFVFEGQITLR